MELQEYIECIEEAHSSTFPGTRLVNLAKYLTTRKDYLARLQVGLKMEIQSLQLDIGSYRCRNEALEALRENVRYPPFR